MRSKNIAVGNAKHTGRGNSTIWTHKNALVHCTVLEIVWEGFGPPLDNRVYAHVTSEAK